MISSSYLHSTIGATKPDTPRTIHPARDLLQRLSWIITISAPLVHVRRLYLNAAQ